MINYQKNYEQMTDDDLLRIATQKDSLTNEAKEALSSELLKRNLSKKDIHSYETDQNKLQDAWDKRTGDVSHFMLIGLGRAFYGRSNYTRNEDGRYEEWDTTLWLIFLWLPIFPEGSFRIKREFMKSSFFNPWQIQEYKFLILKRLPLNWTQIKKTWLRTGIVFGSLFFMKAIGVLMTR